jgi:hypothetical protein
MMFGKDSVATNQLDFFCLPMKIEVFTLPDEQSRLNSGYFHIIHFRVGLWEEFAILSEPF